MVDIKRAPRIVVQLGAATELEAFPPAQSLVLANIAVLPEGCIIQHIVCYQLCMLPDHKGELRRLMECAEGQVANSQQG